MSLAIADGGGISTGNVAAPPPPPPSPDIAARSVVQQATNPATGTVDTRKLGAWVADAAKTSPQAASQAYEAIESQLGTGDKGRFNADVATAFKGDPTYSATGLSFAPTAAGGKILRDNPILEIQWRSTVSPVTNKAGFTRPLQELLDRHGIKTDFAINPRPPGGTTTNTSASKVTNGHAARDALASRLEADPRYQNVLNERDGQIVRQTSLGERHVDVAATQKGARPEMNKVVEVESKLGRASLTTGKNGTAEQVAKDAERLAANAKIRGVGTALETVGKVARPIGLAVDAVQLGSAFHADGDKIGDKTQHAAGSLAGGAAGAWAGAEAGAAVGTLVGGPVGTVVGGLAGAAIGGFVGSNAGEKAVDWVKSWF